MGHTGSWGSLSGTRVGMMVDMYAPHSYVGHIYQPLSSSHCNHLGRLGASEFGYALALLHLTTRPINGVGCTVGVFYG